MNKQKVSIFLVYLCLVLGSGFFISQYVFGDMSDCLCSPENINLQQYCGNLYYLGYLDGDSYCLSMTCYMHVDVVCETNYSPYIHEAIIRHIRLSINETGCCEWDSFWD